MYWLKLWRTESQRWVTHSLHKWRYTARAHAMAMPCETRIVKAKDADVCAWLQDGKQIVAY